MNKIKWVLFSIIASMVIIYSVCYAEISPVSIDDIKDHEKITAKLNQIIGQINSSSSNMDKIIAIIKQDRIDDRQDAKDIRRTLKYQIGLDDKIVKKMIQKGWVAQHSEVEP